MTSKTFRIACIPGDGIGRGDPAGQKVLQALAASQPGLAFEFTSYGWGGDWYRAHRRDDARLMAAGAIAGQGRHPVQLGGRSAHPRPHHAVGLAAEDFPGV